jgi:hypothetical protein
MCNISPHYWLYTDINKEKHEYLPLFLLVHKLFTLVINEDIERTRTDVVSFPVNIIRRTLHVQRIVNLYDSRSDIILRFSDIGFL